MLDEEYVEQLERDIDSLSIDEYNSPDGYVSLYFSIDMREGRSPEETVLGITAIAADGDYTLLPSNIGEIMEEAKDIVVEKLKKDGYKVIKIQDETRIFVYEITVES